MRKVVLVMSVSLDGFMEGPGHDISWHRVDEEAHGHVNDYLRTMGAFVEGRVTHELMTGFWPTAGDDPSSPPPMVDFAAIWRDMPKIVYSRTLPPGPAPWNTTIVGEVRREDVLALKAQPGGDLALGGAALAATFLRLGLVDGYWLYVNPIVLGQGTPVFPPLERRIGLRLVETRPFPNDVVFVRYETAPSAG